MYDCLKVRHSWVSRSDAAHSEGCRWASQESPEGRTRVQLVRRRSTGGSVTSQSPHSHVHLMWQSTGVTSQYRWGTVTSCHSHLMWQSTGVTSQYRWVSHVTVTSTSCDSQLVWRRSTGGSVTSQSRPPHVTVNWCDVAVQVGQSRHSHVHLMWQSTGVTSQYRWVSHVTSQSRPPHVTVNWCDVAVQVGQSRHSHVHLMWQSTGVTSQYRWVSHVTVTSTSCDSQLVWRRSTGGSVTSRHRMSPHPTCFYATMMYKYNPILQGTEIRMMPQQLILFKLDRLPVLCTASKHMQN